MAYMSQERKRALTPGIKAVLKKYGVKATIGVHNHSTIVVICREGPLDIIANAHECAQAGADYNPAAWENCRYLTVNKYWVDSNYTGTVKDFLNELIAACNVGNHDRSDIQSDYFDVGWYIDIRVGTWDKPYEVVG